MKILLILLTLMFTNFTFAASDKGIKDRAQKSEAHDHKDHDHKDQTALIKTTSDSKAVIEVKGMVCAFCAQGIKKNFEKKEAVEKADVDLDKMLVTLTFKKGQSLSKDEIKTVVEGAGFKFEGVK